MHLTQHQRARIRAVRRGVCFEDLPPPAGHTVVHVGDHQVLTWNEGDSPVVGLALVLFDGLPFVAACDVSDGLRGDIASALGVEPLAVDGIGRASPEGR